GPVSGSAMSIRLDDFDRSVTVSAASFASGRPSVDFSGGESTAVLTDEEFFVNGTCYMDIPVKQWYDNIKLAASANGEYALSYDMHRKVQIPANIDASLVELQSFETLEKRSTVVAMLNNFSSAISVQAPEKFFISLELDTFFNADAGNELTFTSNRDGSVSYTLPHRVATPAEVRNFTWLQRNDGAIVLSFPGYGDVILRAIKAITGGYQVLYSLPSEDYGTTYRIRDLVKNGAPVLNEQTIPGRYKFTSISPLPNGSHEYEITFHADKTVSGFVGGYWFQDANGDFVSYECTLAGGKKGTAYEQCAGGLNDPSTITFSHVRRIRFMHQDGSAYQSKYTGSLFQDEDDEFTTFALTYRWVRVGNESDEE
ncbi:MAG: hypothetical protein K0S28_1054, partial [Paucimonas sp.]|nr:hypothetical protein [Paucimonas sp.]